MDYEQLPFKCWGCNEYEHFARSYPKKLTPGVEKEKVEGWVQVKKPRASTRVGINHQTTPTKSRNPMGENKKLKSKNQENSFAALGTQLEEEQETDPVPQK